MNHRVLAGVLVLILVFCSGFALAQEGAIIIETSEGGKNLNLYKETDGQWYESVAKSEAEGCTPNIKSRFAEFETNQPSHARFQPDIPADGNYEIFVTWWNSGNCDKGKYIIHHADGETVQYLMQDGWAGRGAANSNRWHSLGVYRLKKGTDNYVELTDEECSFRPSQANAARFYADAIKFLPTTAAVSSNISMGPAATPALPAPQQTRNTPIPPPIQPNLPSPFQSSSPAVVATPAPGSRTPAMPVVPQTSSSTIVWNTNVSYSQQLAQQQGKGIFAYFYTDTSEECGRFERETFADTTVSNYIKTNFIPLKFDMKQRPTEAYHLGAFRAPTIILYRSDGTPYKRIVGYQNSSSLLNLMRTP
jgi:hypothetical protein